MPTTEPPATTDSTATSAQATVASPTTVAQSTWTSAGVPGDEEMIKAIEQLHRRSLDQFEDPENSDLFVVCAPFSACVDDLEASLDALRQSGAHIEGAQSTTVAEITSVTDLSSVDAEIEPDTRYLVKYVANPLTELGNVVDANGEVLSAVGGSAPGGPEEWTLVRWPDDPELPWRFLD